MVARGSRNREMLVKGHKLSVIKFVLIYSMVIIFNNTVLILEKC